MTDNRLLPLRRAIWLAGTAAILTALPAKAQDAVSDTASESSEIIVTATKRAERLQDVPASVAVVGTDTLTQEGAVKFEDYAAKVPGLSLTSRAPGLRRSRCAALPRVRRSRRRQRPIISTKRRSVRSTPIRAAATRPPISTRRISHGSRC